GARASAQENSPGEVATLVEDFNAMARRLQHMESRARDVACALAHECGLRDDPAWSHPVAVEFTG
ncbi:hypothetical protein C7E17_25240, partial [Stenotrophomonas maltophilia]